MVLSRLIDREFSLGSLSSVKMNLAGSPITHVTFADDLMLLANTREALMLDECLKTYCQWSGQLFNQEKSRLIFSRLVQKESRRRLKCNYRGGTCLRMLFIWVLLYFPHALSPKISNSLLIGWRRGLKVGGLRVSCGQEGTSWSNRWPKCCPHIIFPLLMFVLLSW